MYDNNFGIDAVVQHQYFSGKNCPQTMRTQGLWEYYKEIILIEYQMLQYKKLGFNFEFKSKNLQYLNDKGRVLAKPNDSSIKVNYIITVNYKYGNFLKKEFSSEILADLERGNSK